MMAKINSKEAKLNILQICTNSGRAGAPNHVASISRALSDDFQFSFIFGDNDYHVDKLTNDGYKVSIIQGLSSQISPISDLKVLITLVKNLKKNRPDLIHCHSTKAGFLGRLGAFVCGIPIIYTVHGWGWRGMKLHSAILVKLVEVIMRVICRKTMYIFVDPSSINEAKFLRILPNNQRLILNGVEDPYIRQHEIHELKNPKCIFGMAARVDRSKDHKSLFHALSLIDFEYQLVLCGKGTDSAEFKSWTKYNFPKIYKNVLFLGELENLHSFYTRIDVNILISNFEALPLALIEGNSFSLPAIASDVGGVHLIVQNNRNGYLVEKQSPFEISQAMTKILDDSIRSRFGRESRSIYENHFCVDKMIKKLRNVYQHVLHDG